MGEWNGFTHHTQLSHAGQLGGMDVAHVFEHPAPIGNGLLGLHRFKGLKDVFDFLCSGGQAVYAQIVLRGDAN